MARATGAGALYSAAQYSLSHVTLAMKNLSSFLRAKVLNARIHYQTILSFKKIFRKKLIHKSKAFGNQNWKAQFLLWWSCGRILAEIL